MVDLVIILVIFILLLFALRSSVKHFKGEKTCCSGGSIRTAEKRLDGPVTGTFRMRISGMSCDNCARKVKSAIDGIEGAVASVDYKSGYATVNCDRAVDEIALKEAVRNAGYKVESIS